LTEEVPVDSQEMYCATCAAEAPFEPCSDDRDDCPEWACTRCGEAILLAPLTLVAAGQQRSRRVVPHQRRAA
jgi:DNA-directed RNA polymerase subunit RPC12/RpoP